MTISCDSYTKAESDTKISNLVGAAPVLLNTLVELSAALNNDANYASAITNALAAKAPLASPTFSGTVGGLTKAMVQLGNVDNTTDALKVVRGPTQTALNLKANSEDVFLKTATCSRTQSEALFTYKIDTYTAPLRMAINPVTFATDLRR